MNKTLSSTLIALALSLAACSTGGSAAPSPSSPAASSPSSPGAATPWIMTGTVRNEAGQPLPGVEVFANHPAFYNMNAVGRTDAAGRYRILLAQHPGTWAAGAYLRITLGGETFEVRLSPNDDTSFDGAKGAVRDFTYRAANAPKGKVFDYVAHSNVELDYDTLEYTFTPEGPNAAGSTAPFTYKYRFGSGLPDLPLGQYFVTATQVLNGERQRLLLGTRDDPTFAPRVLARFLNDSHYGPTLELFVKNP